MMKTNLYKYLLALAFAMLFSNLSFAQQDDKWQQKVDGYLSIIESERNQGIADTINYLDALFELSKLYYDAERYNEVIKLSIEADTLYEQYNLPLTGEYIMLLIRLSNSFFEEKFFFQAAEVESVVLYWMEYVYNNGGITIDEIEIGPHHIVETYRALAALTSLIQEPDMEESRRVILNKEFLQKACKLMEEKNIVDSCEYAWDIYDRLSAAYRDEDSLYKAISYTEKMYSICDMRFGEESELCKKALHNLAYSYSQLGYKYNDCQDYYSAARCFESCDSIYHILGDDTSEYHFDMVLNKAECMQKMGWGVRALTIVQNAKSLIEKYYGKDNNLYKLAITLLADLYLEVDDYESRLLYLREIYDIGYYDSNMVWLFYTHIASTFSRIGQMDSTELYYRKAISTLVQSKGDTCLELIYPFNGLLFIYAMEGDESKFDSIVDLGKIIIEKNANDPNIKDADLQSTLTWAAIASSKRWKEAEDFWGRAVFLLLENGRESDRTYLIALAEYIYESFSNGHIPTHLWMFQQGLMANNISQYLMNFSLMSSVERAVVTNNPIYQGIRDIVFSSTCDSSDLVDLFDYSLFCKQQTLNTDREFTESVTNNDDDQLYQYYTDVKEKPVTANGFDERALRIVARNIGSNDWMGFSHDSILQSLGDRDVAVEYVRYNDYRNLATDKHATEKYIALVARKDWDTPRVIPLCNATELTNLVSQKPDNIYRDGGFVSKEIIDLLVAPIIKYAKMGGKIYFSPDGVLYNIAIENMLTDDGQTLGQKYNLIRCSSTRNINEINRKPQFANAVLYGGLDYGEGITQVADVVTRKGWKYLPGTLKEVNSIRQILDRHDIQAVAMTENEGTEQSFMQLSGKGVSILHLATHGFFYTASSSQRETFFDNLRNFGLLDMNINSKEDISPMQRSGLMLSNGNRVWMNEVEKAGDYDGVLLASEVLNMNLFGTELLVLSACETGLGDMSVEGIMGLQRAFKLAGVNTIVMSLWEVDDAATTLMMEQFYENLMSGKSKRESFSLAQQKVRKKYPEPQYWAAFIMLD